MTRVILTLALGLSTALAPLPVLAAPAAQDPQAEAKRLYEEGKTAYRLGDFQKAVEKFEAAYGASGLPTILYNVGLSYERLYTTSNEVAHLRKAVAVLENFMLEVQKDPNLGDPSEVETQISNIKKKIDDHEAAAAAAGGQDKDTQDTVDAATTEIDDEPKGPVGPDPGKKDRKLGAILMGTGGAVLVGGGVGAVVFGLKGNSFEDEIVASYTAFNNAGCEEPSDSDQCAALDNQQQAIRRNGQRANLGAVVLGTVGGVAGLALIGAGAGLFMRGNKRTDKWGGDRDVSIAPTPRGFVISGRF